MRLSQIMLMSLILPVARSYIVDPPRDIALCKMLVDPLPSRFINFAAELTVKSSGYLRLFVTSLIRCLANSVSTRDLVSFSYEASPLSVTTTP